MAFNFPDSARAHLTQLVTELVRENGQHYAVTALAHRNALRRIRARGARVDTVIDVGASDGRWSRMARKVWPQARCHLIEAFDHWRGKLEALNAQDPSYTFTLAAAGADDGEASFFNDPDDPLGGVAGEAPFDRSWIVPQVAIDREVERHGLRPPFLIKLDTHGFERPILEGAAEALRSTTVLVVEVYNCMGTEKNFPAICQHLEGIGFRCVDIGEPLWRPLDGALWQFDLFFEPAQSATFATARFR